MKFFSIRRFNVIDMVFILPYGLIVNSYGWWVWLAWFTFGIVISVAAEQKWGAK